MYRKESILSVDNFKSTCLRYVLHIDHNFNTNTDTIARMFLIGLSYRRDECANFYYKSYNTVKYYENTKTSSDTLFHTNRARLQSKRLNAFEPRRRETVFERRENSF